MKRFLLSVSVLISIWAIWWLIFLNFLDFAFSYKDAIFYLVFAGIDYLIIRWAGGSLNKKFNSILNSFLGSGELELKINKGLLRTYGILIISLLPFLIFLLLLSLFVAISFSLYGFILISYASRIPVAVILALLAIPLGTLIGVLVGMYRIVFPASSEPLGIEIKKSEHQKLWELVREVSTYLNTREVDKIILKPQPGVGVYLKGNNISAMRGKGFRILEIGLPSVDGITVGQFKAILAHEYGHFSNKDTQWAAYTYAMGQGLTKALASVPGPSRHKESEATGIYEGIVSLNPAWWILYLYTKLYFSVTGGFSRVQEVRADLRAIELTGGAEFSEGLKKISINDHLFSSVVRGDLIFDLLKKDKVISNFSKFLRLAESSMSAQERTQIEKEALEDEEESSWDTHPPVKTRLQYASRFKTIIKGSEKPVSSLFDDWDEINEKAAQLYNMRVMAYIKAYSEAAKRQEEKAVKE